MKGEYYNQKKDENRKNNLYVLGCLISVFILFPLLGIILGD